MANFHIENAMLHGKVKDNKQWTQLLFATTHQMYKFYRAFDLIIVDGLVLFHLKRIDHYGMRWHKQEVIIFALSI